MKWQARRGGWQPALAALALAVSACGDAPGARAGADASKALEAAWGYTLTGGVEAAASGATLILNVGTGSATPGGTVGFNSAGRSAGGGVQGQYSYGDDDEAVGEHLAIAFLVRLPDGGMTCGNSPARGVFMTVTVTDASEDSYDATFSGPVVCEDGTAATVEGFLRRRE